MHFMGPKKSEVLVRLRSPNPQKCLPIVLGRYQVEAEIVCEQGEWTLVAMTINREKANAEGKRRLAAGESWMPEMESYTIMQFR